MIWHFRVGNGMIRKIHDWLWQRAKAEILALAILIAVLLLAIDVYGPRAGLSIFYLIPVFLAAWFAGRGAGLAMAVMCTALRTVGRELEGQPHAYPWVFYWNIAIRLGSNVLFVWLVSAVRGFSAQLQSRIEQRTAELRQEVQEREKTEAQLRASEQRFKQMAENIREVFWMTDPGKNQMLYISPGYELIWGRTCASLYRSPRDWLEAIHAEDRPRIQEAALVKQATGEYDEEYRILRPDGTMRWIRDRAFPVRDEHGKIFRIAGIADDITERKVAETAIRERDQRLRVVLERAPIVVFAISKGGDFTMCEGHALYDVDTTPGALVGRNVRDVFSARPWLRERVARALDGEEFIASDEFRGQVFATWHAPQRNEHGEIIGMVGVATNVTERVNLQRQVLEISDREQVRIGQDLHDGLCQHLVGIAFAANTLEEKLAAARAEQVAEAREIAMMLDEAITQARKTARGLYPVRLEAEGLALALAELANYTRERHGVSCRFDYPEPVLLSSDMVAMQLYRIAQEGVLNAVKHAAATEILIRLIRDGEKVELFVTDDGVGIPEPLPAGQGMGLSIIKYRASTIDGTFRVRRRAEGGTGVYCSVMERIPAAHRGKETASA